MRRATNQSGFTLIELLVVVALIVILVGALATAVNTRACTKAIDDAKQAVRSCDNVLTGTPTMADVADCTHKAQNALTAICTAGCEPGQTLTALVNEANELLRKYRDSLPEADRTRVVERLGFPC